MAEDKVRPGKQLSDAERTEQRLKTRELARMLFRASQEPRKGERRGQGGGDADQEPAEENSEAREARTAARKEAWSKERETYQVLARRFLRLLERSETVDVTFKFSEETLARAAKASQERAEKSSSEA